MLVRLYLLLTCLLLSACNLTPKKTPAEIDDLTIEIIETDTSIIKTVPLMKPAVQALHYEATELHQLGEYDKALRTLKRAHNIQTNAPQIMMLIAEISLQQGENSEAFYWSRLASENAPSIGPICEKIWRLLAISAEMLGETPFQYNALEQKEECLVRQQDRF
jgi:tetratricopeptide (TPR) repeat protein